MKDVIIRALRTYLQVFFGLLLVSWASVKDYNTGLTVLATAAVAAVPALLSFLQNVLEGKVDKNNVVPGSNPNF